MVNFKKKLGFSNDYIIEEHGNIILLMIKGVNFNMNLIEEIKEGLSTFESLYDHMRIVNPSDKKNIVVRDGRRIN